MHAVCHSSRLKSLKRLSFIAKNHAAICSQTLNVTAESIVLMEIAATANSGSPPISFAMTRVTVAGGDARMIIPGI